MNYFISLERNENEISYFFNKNHFVILLLSLVIIIFFSMYLSRQKLKFQKIATFFVTLLIIAIEGLRIFWNYKYLDYNGEDLNFFSVTGLDFFTICLWISIPLMLLASFLKKKDKTLFGLSFVFSAGGLFGIISLIYPLNINSYFEFYHCSNIMYILLRSFLIMMGLFFAFAKWISVFNFLDLWKSIFSLVVLFAVCYGIVYFLTPSQNYFYLSFFPPFESLGVHLSFPWHVLLMSAFLFTFQILMYIPFFIHKARKIRHGEYLN